MTFTPTKKAYLNATLDIASSGSPTSPDSAALSGIGIITQPPPPGLAQLPGDEGCLTYDGREVADDATTAGRCKAAPGIGRINNGWLSSPNNVLVSPDGKNVYTTSYNPLDSPVERDGRAVARREPGALTSHRLPDAPGDRRAAARSRTSPCR